MQNSTGAVLRRWTPDDAGALHALATRMLTWRAEHADRTLTGFLLTDGGIGRWP